MLGPLSVLADDIKLAGFWCKLCHRPVEVARQNVPTLAPRACLFACACDVGVVVWEHETQPDRQSWSRVMKQARKGDVALPSTTKTNRPSPDSRAATNPKPTPSPKMPTASLDHDEFPAWVPRWLKKLVYEPECSTGTHPTLRTLAKWLVIFMPLAECEGLAFHWLKVAAQKCPRVADDAELKRLLAWPTGRTSDNTSTAPTSYISQPAIDIDDLYELIVRGPTRNEFRECSPLQLYNTRDRNTTEILDAWGRYSGDANPWICYRSKDYFFTRRLSEMRDRAHVFEQIVPSPMKQQQGKTISGHLSQHSLEATGSRLFLVVEFDFVPLTHSRQPTIWAPLIKRAPPLARSSLARDLFRRQIVAIVVPVRGYQ
jgi:hypothetical protein